jgi:protocatechuate 3,4-dioxygenase beta subunit
MRLIAFAWLFAAGLAAQPGSSSDKLCTIEGHVVNAVTGEPLKNANVTLYTGSFRDPAPSTTTGADGSFAMKDIEPTSYRISGSRSGFLTMEYGARKPNQVGTHIVLTPGQALKDVELRLIPQAVISGRVTNEEDEPMERAEIQLYQLRYDSGRKKLARWPMYPAAGTNDLGEYRIFGLSPGRYAMAATYRAGRGYGVDHSVVPRKREDYVPTYYPNTPDVNLATIFDVAAGAQIRGIDVKLTKVHSVRVSGRVINAAMKGAALFVSLGPANSGKGGFGAGNMQADESGKFSFPSVVPGTYTLTAGASSRDKYIATRIPLEVRDEDIDNLAVTIVPGIALPGQVLVEGAAQADLNKVSFSLLSPNDDGGGLGNLKPDRTFLMEDVSAGHYFLRPNYLPDGFYVKSARMGESDVLDGGADVGADTAGPLQIVLSPHAGQVTGRVQNPDTQMPAAFSVVVLAPEEKARREQEWFYSHVTADRAGSFTLKNIAPGNYMLYAWEEIESGAYLDPDFLKPFESKAQAVSIKEDDRVTLQIDQIANAP